MGRLALADQRAFSNQRPANPARNRRNNRRVSQVDAGRLDICLAHGHIGFRLLLRSHRVGIFLLAHRIRFDQRFIAIGQCSRLRRIGFSTSLTGLGACNRCSVGCSIYREQGLTGLDIAALAEKALLQNTGRTRPDLRYA